MWPFKKEDMTHIMGGYGPDNPFKKVGPVPPKPGSLASRCQDCGAKADKIERVSDTYLMPRFMTTYRCGATFDSGTMTRGPAFTSCREKRIDQLERKINVNGEQANRYANEMFERIEALEWNTQIMKTDIFCIRSAFSPKAPVTKLKKSKKHHS